ncbi:MAG: hypothetical protein OEL87_01555 [Nanoarchaeota archaeon]|nr:hypothetical protein [Nanoarchaeota archaeon]
MNEGTKDKNLNKKLAIRILKYLIVNLRGKSIIVKDLKRAKFGSGTERDDYVCKTRTSDGMKTLIFRMEKFNLIKINKEDKENFTDYEIKLSENMNEQAERFNYSELGAEILILFIINKKRRFREWCFDLWNLTHNKEDRIDQRDIPNETIGKIGQEVILVLYDFKKPMKRREMEKELRTNSVQLKKWLSFLKEREIIFERYSEGTKTYSLNQNSSMVKLFSFIPEDDLNIQELFLSNTLASGEEIYSDLLLQILMRPEYAKLLPNV